MDASKINVGDTERLASAAIGLLLTAKGLRRRSLLGGALAAVGAGLIYRGLSGHCAGYEALDLSTAGRLSFDQEHTFVQTLQVNCPPEELLGMARSGINRLLATAEPVHILSAATDDSFSFTSGRHWGRVWVTTTPEIQGERASRLGVAISFFSGDGLVEKPLDAVTRPIWEHHIRESLRQFKAWVEAGEVATTDGQTHGHRGTRGVAMLAFLAASRQSRGSLRAMRRQEGSAQAAITTHEEDAR